MGLGRLFGGRAGQPNPEAARIKVAALAILPRGSSVTVNEILCPDPACPDLETVILVMREGAKTRAYKIAKPMEAVTEQDLASALVPVEGAEC
jgi:hypothetical protein